MSTELDNFLLITWLSREWVECAESVFSSKCCEYFSLYILKFGLSNEDDEDELLNKYGNTYMFPEEAISKNLN